MIRFFQIKFNLHKNPVEGCISVKANNKIEAIIIANKRAIELSVDIQIQEIKEITDDEYFDNLNPRISFYGSFQDKYKPDSIN